MLAFDTTRRPVRPSEWRAVLEAVLVADENDEQSWLEWKSTANLTSKHDQVELICRHILAMANRLPDEAAKAVSGCGILILGLEPGAVHGVDPADNADLDKWLSAYLGTSNGPGWTPHWDRLEGKSVLMIEVEAPKQGDPIFTLEKTFGSRDAGTIFVRRRARSEIADPEEVRALSRRLLPANPSPRLDVALTLDVTSLPRPVVVDPNGLGNFCEKVERRLLDALPKPASPASPFAATSWMQELAARPSALSSFLGSYETPEDRSEDEYRSQVAAYLVAVRKTWPKYIEELAESRPSTIFKIENLTEKNIAELELTLHVDGDVSIARSSGSGDRHRVQRRVLPRPPRMWGPKKPEPSFGAPTINPPNYAIRDVAPRAHFENGGSFTVTFVPVNLRPYETATLDNEHLLLFGPDVALLRGSWHATSRNFDGMATGHVDWPVDPDPFYLM